MIFYKSPVEPFSNELFDKIDAGQHNDSWNQSQFGQNFVDCYNLPPNKCLNYSNCGLCIKNGHPPKCIPGDEQGPLFKEGCDKWAYGDYYDRNNFAEKVVRVVDPWDKFYPTDYEASYPSPISRSALQ
jgi:hypothetical protein